MQRRQRGVWAVAAGPIEAGEGGVAGQIQHQAPGASQGEAFPFCFQSQPALVLAGIQTQPGQLLPLFTAGLSADGQFAIVAAHQGWGAEVQHHPFAADAVVPGADRLKRSGG